MEATVESVKRNGTPTRKLTPLRVRPSEPTPPPEQQQSPPDEEPRKLPLLLKLVHLENSLLRLPFHLLMNHAAIIEQVYRWELLLHEFVGTFRGGLVSDKEEATRNEMCVSCPVGFTYEANRYCMGCT